MVSSKLIENLNRIEPSSPLSTCRVGIPFGGVFQKPFKFGCPSDITGVAVPSAEQPTHGSLAATFCACTAPTAMKSRVADDTAVSSDAALRWQRIELFGIVFISRLSLVDRLFGTIAIHEDVSV